MPAQFDLTGQTALVTGAGRGIGRAVAVALAAAGADVVLHARRAADLDDVAREVTAAGRTAARWILDLSDPARVADAAAGIGPIDILVNNAGLIRRGPSAEQSLTEWRKVLDTNLDAVFVLTRTLGSGMLRRGHGRVVMIASLLSFQGGFNVAAYTASKHAVAGLTKALANEWTERGVLVNAIAPGYIATANTRPLREDAERELAIRRRIPAGRWGRPEDVAGAAVFLASPAAGYVAGHVLAVDGGWLAR
ncbi:SDR family oxidoreductase [Dactylosporangium aurantiacum]|uniref:SDR family oxidoreductase n=1 Tax=Dactylosporangium aurantiacum TaxID=35754 RepID=A0A9Q9IQY3_9ACTN|nr:SDR family oxidoreductase [Dactylosporangium aurantiacum]MDG6101745.1 SDR family oxidoreductase [Dactylosporangium aurantiacum]UWZ59971.1 SDR family oxidoreductase [Dactylosporangium aurantiacum]